LVQTVKQGPHRAGGGFALNTIRLAASQRRGIGVQKTLSCRMLTRCAMVERLRADPDAGQHAYQVKRRRRQGGFVKVVDVETEQPVVALVAAKVLRMQIAAGPDQRRSLHARLLPEPVVKQMATASEKGEVAGAHPGVLDGQQLRVAARVELPDVSNGVHQNHSLA
jgi:hypothetical protein